MKTRCGVMALFLLPLLVLASFLPVSAGAQTYPPSSTPLVSQPEGRTGTWDFLVPLTYNPSTHWDGQGGSRVDLDDGWGFGFGAGYNFSDSFQLNGLFTWSGRDYTATVVNSDLTRRDYRNTLYTSTFSVNGVLYFLKGKINPFLSGGVGITYLDTNIQNGPGTTSCWWDPWYGYICGSSAPTKSETDVSYNAGVGVRFDIMPQFSLQPSYNKMWIDIDRASGGMPEFDVWRMDLIFRF